MEMRSGAGGCGVADRDESRGNGEVAMVRMLMVVVALALPPAVPCRAAEQAPLSVQGLRDCPGGGVILPGSDACLRLSGAVSATTAVRTPTRGGTMRQTLTRSGTSAHVDLDLRAPTSLGPVRVYTSIRMRDGLGGARIEP